MFQIQEVQQACNRINLKEIPTQTHEKQSAEKKRPREGLSWWYSGCKSNCQSRGTGSVSGLGRFHILQSNEACAPQLLIPCTTTTTACAPRACALQQKKPLQWEAHAPHQRAAPSYCNQRKPKCSNVSFMLSTVSKVFSSSARKVLICNTREQTGYYVLSISAGTLAKSKSSSSHQKT